MSSHDLVLHGGPIMTLDPTSPYAEAVAVRGDRIVAVGDAESVRAAVRPGYQTLDLRGRTAVPGLCDAHIHLLWTALHASQINLESSASLETALATIQTAAEKLSADAWVVGYGWDHSVWGGHWPTAAQLDTVTGGRPAYFTRKDLHSAWVNAAALRIAGVDADMPDPEGGAIDRDQTGAPTGMLFELAVRVVASHIPQPNAAAKQTAIRHLIGRLQQHGITSIHVPEGPDCLAAVQGLYGRGELGMRVLHHIPLTGLEAAIELGLRSGLGDNWLRLGGIKIFSDGSLGSYTAHMLEPFHNLPTNAPHPRGIAMLETAELQRVVERAIGNHWSVIVHAIGDAANRNVLDAIEAALRQHPESLSTAPPPLVGRVAPHLTLLPNRIEHAQIVHAADMARFARLGIVASVQPLHATSDMDVADRLWGERCAGAYAWRSLLESGAIVAFGSDAPVDSWNPWAGIHAAVTRQRPNGDPPGGWYPAQCLSLEEALWGYTVGPALTSGELAHKGTLAVGKLADIVVLDRDLAATDSHELHRVATDVTMLGGEIVWERGA